jgi:flagellar hook-length control protein FliK
MQIEFVSAAPNVAPATESTDASSESSDSGVVSFADLLNAAADEETQSAQAAVSDDEAAPAAASEWMTVPVFVPFVPVTPVADAIEEPGDGAARVEEVGDDDSSIDATMASSSKSVRVPSVSAFMGERAQPPADTELAKPAAEIESLPAATPPVETQPIATAVDVHPKVVQSESAVEHGTPLVVDESREAEAAAKPGAAAKRQSIAQVDGINEKTKPSVVDAIVNRPQAGDAQQEVAASPAKGASETSSAVPTRPKGTATRFARALERAAAASAVQRAAEASPENGSSFNPSSGNQSSVGEWLREPLPQITTGRSQSAAPQTSSLTAALPGDVRLSGVLTPSLPVLSTTAPTLPNEQDVTLQIVQSMRVQFRDGVGEAVLKLKPEHLGSVSISLRVENGGLKASVQAEAPAVRQWLESQQDTLRNALAEHGLRLDRFDVEPDGQRQASPDDPRDEQSPRRRRPRRTSQAEEPVFEVVV